MNIILFNGPSSSGKSSAAKELYKLTESEGKTKIISIDDYLMMSSEEPIWEDDVFDIMPKMREDIQSSSSFDTLIIDHVITSERIFDYLIASRSDIRFFKVRFTASDEVLTAREIGRKNRYITSAELSKKYLYPQTGYDYIADSGIMTPAQIADEIYSRLKKTRIVDEEITPIPYYPNEAETLLWYRDPELCKQVDNIDYVYDSELLNNMYSFLSSNGDCYYISYNGQLVGDVTLRDNNELAIVVEKNSQNKHIGRRVIKDMLKLAREKGAEEVCANIYSFNTQSRKMFESIGFIKTDEEWFKYIL